MAGNGTYVTNTEDHVSIAAGWVSGRNLLIEKYDSTLEYINIQQASLAEYLEEYQDLIDTFQLPEGWEDVLDDVIIKDVTGIDPAARPGIGNLTLNTNWPTNFPLQPFLADPPEIDLGYSDPVKPDAVNPTISHVDDTFNSDVYAALTEVILNDIRNNGRGWGAATEDAIYERAKSRFRKANEAEYIKGLNFIGNIGAAMPEGASVAMIYRLQETIAEQESDINNDIIANQSKLAWDADQAAQDRAVQVEQILRAFHEQKNSRSLEAEIANGNLVMQVYAEQVRGYIAEWEGVKLNLESQMMKTDVVLKRNALLVDRYRAEWDGYKAQVEAIASENESRTRALEAEARAYIAETSAYEAWYNALSQQQIAELKKAELQLEKAKAEMNATLQALIATSNLKSDAIRAMSEMAAQAVASGMGAFNASIGHSTNSSEGISESYSHSDGISESHSFDETAT